MKLVLILITLLTLSLSEANCDASHLLNTNAQYSELKVDLENLFKFYGNSTFILRLDQLRKFLDDFSFKNLIKSQPKSKCIQKKLKNLYNLTMTWPSDTLIDRNTFSKISAYLVSYLNKCFGDKFNSTEYYYVETPLKLSPTENFKNNVAAISKESNRF
jgi:hypothetical protein